MNRHRTPSLLVLVSILIFSLGCATASPVIPGYSPTGDTNPSVASSSVTGGHMLWGTWEFAVDLENGTVDAVPLRSADLHFNVVPLLKEGVPGTNLTFSNVLIDGPGHTMQIDVTLEHPFPLLVQIPGFDVRGIFITRGDDYYVETANAILTGPSEPRLVNADGYTRWWNPLEFNGPPLLGYTDGFWGAKEGAAGFASTLYGYKYFADGLQPLDSLDDLNVSDRGVFRPGSSNTRRYLIDFGSDATNWLIFNYAVDACWGKLPGWEPGNEPPELPEDFPLSANCPEPYRIRVSENVNSLSATTAAGTTGGISLNIDVFDWQALDPVSSVPMEVTDVFIEVPSYGIAPVLATVVPGSGAGGHMSTYEATILGSSPDKLSELEMIIVATDAYGNYQPDITYFAGGDPLQAFYLYGAKVQDADTYTGWVHRYTKLLYPEQPNQGDNPPDIATYHKSGEVRAITIDQLNPDPNGEGGHMPDSVNEWTDDYESYSLPEHYHLPTSMLGVTMKWDDIGGICISDIGSRFFFTSTSSIDEFSDGENDPLYSYFMWTSHIYLGNAPAEAWNTVFFSAGNYPRYWATDPSNGVSDGTIQDYIYACFIYDTTGFSGPNPGVDTGRYTIFRWQPPYQATPDNADWQRAVNSPPSGEGVGYVDRDEPYNHRLAVDDSAFEDRFYILDTLEEIEVIDCDFTQEEWYGSTPIGTVTTLNWPVEITGIVDLEVIQTKPGGEPRNYVAALCTSPDLTWRVWVFDYDDTQPIDSQAVTIWLSDAYDGLPCSLDAVDDPVEVHVLHKGGGMINVSVFRDYP